MKLVLTVLARDEADVIDAQVAFHLNAGVDFVIATDNNSRDGTTEILEEYERAGCLRLIREPAEGLRQGEWVTRMARLAAREHGADWVVHGDADEFWWPLEGDLRQALTVIGPDIGIVPARRVNFLPMRRDQSRSVAEKPVARITASIASDHTMLTTQSTLPLR